MKKSAFENSDIYKVTYKIKADGEVVHEGSVKKGQLPVDIKGVKLVTISDHVSNHWKDRSTESMYIDNPRFTN